MIELFKKKKYATMNPKKESPQKLDEKSAEEKPAVPEGLFVKCPECNNNIYKKDLEENNRVCPRCSKNFRIGARERIEMLIDRDTFEEMDIDLLSVNPLDFKGYENKIRAAQEKSELKEAIVTGKGQIHGKNVVIGVMDADFMMASMGSVVGEKITRAVEYATENKLPIILFTASGGARMQEGIFSLMQMAKTSAALAKHNEAGLLYIPVLTDPTTGGVTASFAMLGDIILAEPGALIGFAGPRVIQQTIRQTLPEDFQRAEFLLEHGFIDKIVPRGKMKDTLGNLLKLHGEVCIC